MNMKRIYILFIVSSLALFFFSCEKEDKLLDESVVKVKRGVVNELDEWIYQNLTLPYNLEVKYKWDDGEVSNSFHVVPPKVEKAKEFLEAYLNIWIKTYEAEATDGGNPDYMKKFMPKLLVLIGCPQYNSDGTMTLGLAEGGRKVTIFGVDQFAEIQDDKSLSNEEILQMKRTSVAESFHTLHHEFAHIMHQTKFYPDEFKEICKGDYTGNWKDIDDLTANVKGFITPYSMLNENEDFVETVAGMLTNVFYSNESKLWKDLPAKDKDGKLIPGEVNLKLSLWEAKLYLWGVYLDEENNISQMPEAIEGLNRFQTKVDMITTYYKEKWGIDLYSLQKRIETAIYDVVK